MQMFCKNISALLSAPSVKLYAGGQHVSARKGLFILLYRALKLCCGLQDQGYDIFLHTVKCASLFGMPKLLACCEYYIALESLQTSHTLLMTRSTSCLSKELLGCSSIRIAEGFCMAFKGLADQVSCMDHAIVDAASVSAIPQPQLVKKGPHAGATSGKHPTRF